MTDTALIVTYHAVEAGPPPLCVEPDLFARQLDALCDEGATFLTVTQLARSLAAGSLPARAVALTFDDGFASVARHAAPLIVGRGARGTVFCVAGHLGGSNDWRTQPRRARRRPLAGAADLRELAAAGFEIGSHGMTHSPLSRCSPDAVRRELEASKQLIEQETGHTVSSFAYPYGELPVDRSAVAEHYEAACGSRLGLVRAEADRLALPRVDAHYVRRPALLRAAAAGRLGTYLAARRSAARVRRLAVRDYTVEGAA